MTEENREIKFDGDAEILALLEKYRGAAVPRDKFAAAIRLFDLTDTKGYKAQSSLLLDEMEKDAYTEEQRNIVLIKRGENLLRQSRFDEASVHLEKAIVGLSQQPDSLDLFQAYRNMAWIYFRQGYLERARSFTDGAGLVLEMRSGKNDRETKSARAHLYHILGLIESSSGEQDIAIGHYDREIELLEELEETSRMGSVFNNLSGIYKTKGMYSRALDFQRRSFETAERSGEMLSLAISCNNLGEIYCSLGKYPQAREFYTRYLEINERINNIVGNAFGLAGLGRICQNEGDYGSAEQFFVKALHIAEEVKSKGKEAGILAEMSELYLQRNNPEMAVQYLDRAIKISLEIERFNTHRHQVLNAKIILKRGLEKASDKEMVIKARDILTDVLSRTITIEDEEAVSAIELEIDARFALALAEHHLGNKKNAIENIGKAEEKIDFISGQLDEEFRESFLARKDITGIFDLKNIVNG